MVKGLCLAALLATLLAGCGGDSSTTQCKGACCRYPSVDSDCTGVGGATQPTAWTCKNLPAGANVDNITGLRCARYSSPQWEGFCCI